MLLCFDDGRVPFSVVEATVFLFDDGDGDGDG
jgi:hypothetical protein